VSAPHRLRVVRWILIVAVAACGARPPAQPAAPDRVAIVAAERGAEGARLVAIDEHGDRQLALVAPPTETMVRDTNPAVSPDGAWLVFSSSRARALDQTSLWIARLGVAAVPRRLTDGPGIDAHPTWTPDGRAIVFASTRGGSFDLWRLELADGRAGALAQLTQGAGHEVTPAVASDGTIFYAAVTPDEAHRQVETHLEARAPDGTIRRLTDGPADSSPAVSPDGTRVVFARPQLHDGKLDSELWLLVRATGTITPLVDLPLTDESGPVWSRDGRFVFATSVLRGADGHVLFSSVIHVDLRDRPAVARILEDRVGAIVRMTPAIAAPLDAAALHADPEYLPELARIMSRAIEKQGSAQP